MTIVNEQWDYLIILDACRYDYFERLWREYFPDGRLSCRQSPGTCTNEWRDKTFPGFYEDIVYITANPQICITYPVYGYMASEHFRDIHEIWRLDWDEEHGTVLPDVLTRRAMQIIPEYPQEKRFVIHYLQPHAPYLNAPYGANSKSLDEFNHFLLNPDAENTFNLRQRVFRRLLPLCSNKLLFSNNPEWTLRKLLRIPPKGPMEFAWRQVGISGLRKVYEENLRIALHSVKSLIEHLSGTIIITSDHGELLGEGRQFAHPANSQNALLRNVPWLVITKGQKTEFPEDTKKSAIQEANRPSSKDRDDESVVERLRALGYM